MSESASNSEFLFGLEEYLKYLEEDITADEVHSFAKSLQAEDKVVQLIKSYLQYMIPNLPLELIDLADLTHGFNKSTNPSEEVYKTLLTYCNKFLKKVNTDQDLSTLADLCHNTKTAADIKDIYKALLLHNTNILKSKGLDELGIETGKILRSMDQDDFDEFIVKTRLVKLDKQFPNDKIFRGILNYRKLGLDSDTLQDAFSRSQIKSKIWLIKALANIDNHYDNILIMAGWFGQLKNIYDNRLTYAKMRIAEIDKSACETSDYIINLTNLENHKVKAVNVDINNLTLHKNGYEWNVENFKEGTAYDEKFLPNLIINTSAEHMSEEWFHQLRFKQLESNPIVAIQSNNLFDIPEHVNCVHSVDHMKKKFPMKEILYEGELQLKGYKRVMLIGRP